MNKIQTFEQFLTGQSNNVPLGVFLVNLLIALVLAAILARIYTKYGYSVSDRKGFSKIFILLTLTTTLIITVVKSSLALSLGLVGALSIVRFRAAIKEPEELAYLFMCIGIGLGLGADQQLLSVGAFIVICIVLVVRGMISFSTNSGSLQLIMVSKNRKKENVEKTIEILSGHCTDVSLKRLDDTASGTTSVFTVNFDSIESLMSAKEKLNTLDPSADISCLDSRL